MYARFYYNINILVNKYETKCMKQNHEMKSRKNIAKLQ